MANLLAMAMPCTQTVFGHDAANNTRYVVTIVDSAATAAALLGCDHDRRWLDFAMPGSLANVVLGSVLYGSIFRTRKHINLNFSTAPW